VGRLGAAILQGVGHPEWIAESERQYVDKAVALAQDAAALAAVRGNLRERMRSSLLMDERAFSRSVEAACRQLWRRWCQGPAGVPDQTQTLDKGKEE
jgi:protein O-GlcNAc transferase